MRFGGRQPVPINMGNALLRQARPGVPIKQGMPQMMPQGMPQQQMPAQVNFPQKTPYQQMPFNNMLLQGMGQQNRWRNPLLQFMGMRFG